MDEIRRLLAALYGVRIDGVEDAKLRSAAATAVGDNPLMRRIAEIAPKTVDEKARTVDITITTEAPVAVIDWERWEVVDEVLLMAGLRMDAIRRNKLPLLNAHKSSDADHVLGSVINLRVDGDEFRGTEVWSATEDKVWTKVREGHLDQRSVGYRRAAVTYIKPGETAQVNGRTFTASGARALEVVTAWEAKESSVTPIGADPNAGTRSSVDGAQAGAKATKDAKGADMNLKELRAKLEKLGLKADATDDEVLAFAAAKIGAPADPPAAGSGKAAPGTETASPSAGTSGAEPGEILDLFRAFETTDGMAEIRDTCLREKVTLDVARGRMVEHLSKAHPSAGRAVVTADDDTKFRGRLVAGLTTRIGMQKVDPKAPADAAVKAADEGADFRYASLMDLARACLEYRGVATRRMNKLELVGRAFTHSTGDFPYALANVAEKSLLGAYKAAPTTWQEWCQRGSLSDFKTAYVVKVGEFSVFPDVPEGAEFPYTTVAEDRETIYLLTYGDIFSVTRQAMINDDLGVLTDTPVKFGRAWARTINRRAVVILLANGNMTDGNALFSSAHSNIDTGAGYACDTVAHCQAALAKLVARVRNQTGTGGNVTLGLQPSKILCGSSGEPFWAQTLFETGRADSNVNVWIKRLGLTLVVEPEIENSAITGYSTLKTHCFCDPQDAPVIRVAFLDGQDAPRLETQNGFHVDGVELKAAGDVGVGKVDWRGAAQTPGA